MTAFSIPYPHVSADEKTVTELFSGAGITINGKEDFDIQINDSRFFKRVLTEGSLGLGESYVSGWWNCHRLDIFFTKIIRSGLDHYVPHNIKHWIDAIQVKLFNNTIQEDASTAISFHYDIGNDLFTSMLDKRLTYTCAYWKDAFTLDEAQEAKLELVCRKLHLTPGMSVLDIGCGWGSFVKYAAEKYQVQVTGITLSKEQLHLAKELCQGLPVKFELKDYREVTGEFDRIVSLGMFEHVGSKDYKTYFETVNRCLKQDGIFLLHTIGTTQSSSTTDPWLNKYIFPNSVIPCLSKLTAASEGLFVLEDLHNFGIDYDTTLMEWYHNIVKNYSTLKTNYTGRFFRTWSYYLLCCAGSFRARKNQLWQCIFSKGLPGGYTSIR